MRFDSLWSAGFAVSLGMIVLMYLLKRKYVDTVVPSHVLWNRVLQNMEANRPWQKLRNRLLLWIQLLVAALLVLALMQPSLLGQGETKSHVVLIADASASMSALDAVQEGQINVPSQSRIEQMKKRMIDYVNGPANGSAVTLIRMAGQPELLESKQTEAAHTVGSIEGLDIHYGKTAYQETMSLAASLTKSDPDAEIVVYTDGQWPETMEGLVFPVAVRIERIEGTGGNVGIAQFGVKALDGGTAQGVAVVRNGTALPQRVEATLRDLEKALEVRELTLQPGEQTTLRFERLPSATAYSLTLAAQDALQADNTAFAFLSSQGAKRVLLLTQGNLFLEKALQIAGAEVIKLPFASQEGNEGAPNEELPLPTESVDIVVLDGVPNEVVAGPKWSELLAHKPVWTLVSGEDNMQAVPAGAFSIADHPVNRYLRMDDVHLSRLSAAGVPAWGEPIVQIGGKAVVYAGSDSGQAKLLFAFNLHESDLPLRAEFPILVRNALDWLGDSRQMSLGRIVAGSTVEIPLSAQASTAAWIYKDGALRNAGAQSADMPAATTGTGTLAAYQPAPTLPGLYQFVQKDPSGAIVASPYAEVIVDARETNLALQPELSFKRDGGQASNAADGQAMNDALGKLGTGTERSLVPWIAALLMLMLLLEWGVYQRGDSI